MLALAGGRRGTGVCIKSNENGKRSVLPLEDPATLAGSLYDQTGPDEVGLYMFMVDEDTAVLEVQKRSSPSP